MAGTERCKDVVGHDGDVASIAARLSAAAEAAERVELILVVRGRVRPIPSTDRRRWQVRLPNGRRLTIWADWVVAATSIALPGVPSSLSPCPSK
jgi:hypothetical protein